jgi:hypothetical protein
VTKTLYAYRPKSNPSFMIVHDTQDTAKYIAKGWLYYASGLHRPYDDEKMEEDLRDWELITLTVEEDE